MLATTAIFLAFPLLSAAYSRLDLIILSFFRGDAEVGWYSAAYRIIDFAAFLPAALAGAALPALSALSSTGDRLPTADSIFGRLIEITIPGAFLGMLLAPQLVSIFGSDFAPAAPALVILLGAGIFLFVHHVAGTMLIALGRERELTRIVAWATALNLALNLATVPFWGYLGAALATVVTEAAILYWCKCSLDQALPGALRVKEAVWLLAVGAAAAGLAWMAAGTPIGKLAVFAAVYLPGYYLWRGHRRNSRRALEPFEAAA